MTILDGDGEIVPGEAVNRIVPEKALVFVALEVGVGTLELGREACMHDEWGQEEETAVDRKAGTVRGSVLGRR